MSISQDWQLLQRREEALRLGDYATTKFWQRVFNKHIFNGDQWDVFSQQPPTPTSQRPNNLVIEGWGIRAQESHSHLLIVELKHGLATPKDTEEVQNQALNACAEHARHTNRETLWAMTCFGPNARLWAYSTLAPHLVGFYPKGGNSNIADDDSALRSRSLHLDICEKKVGFLDAFRHIKQNPDPSPDLFLPSNKASSS
jgi:hypothetical protein